MKKLFMRLLYSKTKISLAFGLLLSLPISAQTFQWAKSMGASSYDWSYSIAADASGNVYTTGIFNGTADFDPGTGTYTLTSAGSGDIFISKLDASGNFVWAKNMGGTSDDYGLSVAVDASGNVYTTGEFQGASDFDPGTGTYNLTSAGGTDIFVSKLDASGNFVWAKNMGGINQDKGRSIAVDASGNVHSTGHFQGTADFDPGTGTYNLISAGLDDIFISKLDASGNFVWAKSMGGASDDYGLSVAVDASGNVHGTGYFQGAADFDPGTGTYSLTSSGGYDIFVSKLNASGNFVWAKNMGGNSSDFARSITLDGSGNVYTTGNFFGTADFDPGTGTYNLVSFGMNDICISKLDASGNFVWAKNLGGTSDDYGYSIAVDTPGNVYTTGYFRSTADFDPGTGSYTLTSVGGQDIFISNLDASGNFVWANNTGGSSDDWGYSIALAASCNIYTTGTFQGTADFDAGVGVSNLVSAGGFDVFVTKYTDCSQTTGIPVISGISDYFKIYPNPANSLINIEAFAKTPFEISMMNVYGEIILKQQTVGSQCAIDVSKFESGVYFIQAVSQGKTYNHKIIITHQ